MKKKKKPNNYYTKDRCIKIALGCDTRYEFKKKNPCAYAAACKNGWLSDCFANMGPSKMQYPSGWWKEKQHVLDIAKLYTRRVDFKENNRGAYDSALDNGWIDEACAHMDKKETMPIGWWDDIEHCKERIAQYNSIVDFSTKEKGCLHAIYKHKWQDELLSIFRNHHPRIKIEDIYASAKKYDDYRDFMHNEPKMHAAARERGILDDVCKNMARIVYNRSQDTLDEKTLKDVASQYIHKKVFKEEHPHLYRWALKNKLWKIASSHMKPLKTAKQRCIYVAMFDDNHAYIGLTFSTDQRWYQHTKGEEKSSIKKHMKETGLKPQFIQLTEYMPEDEAQMAEEEYEQLYADMGWFILNRAPTGSLGYVKGLKKEEVIKKAKEFKTFKDFRIQAARYYNTARRNKYIQEIKSFLPHKKTRLSDEEIEQLAKTCKTLKEFNKKNRNYVIAAKKRGILNTICSHMESLETITVIRVSEEEVLPALEDCKCPTDLYKKNLRVYRYLKAHDRINYYFPGMLRKNATPHRKGYSEEEITSAISQCEYRIDFINKFPSIYSFLQRRNLLDRYLSELKRGRHTKYTEEEILQAVSECEYLSDMYKKHRSIYFHLQREHTLAKYLSGLKRGIKPRK